MQEQSTDMLIIQKVLQGQQQAFAVLVDRYQSYVFTIAMRFANDRELAEELTQDVFVKAYRYLADFKGNSKFSTWLYTIVNTTYLSHIRKKKDNSILLEEERMIAIADDRYEVSPSAQLEQKTQKQLMESAIKQLPEQDAQLISLFYLGEQSIEEVGVIMGLTTSNVKVRLFRARQKLKEVLETSYGKEFVGTKSNNA